MPSDEEISNAIAEMRKQGLSDDEIRETLADMGVAEDVISRILGSSAPASDTSPVSGPTSTASQDSTSEGAPQPQQASSPVQSSGDDLFANIPSEPKDVVSSLISGSDSISSDMPAGEDHGDADTDAVPSVSPISSEPKPLAPPPVKASQSPIQQSTASVPGSVSYDDVAEIKEMLRELKKELKDQRALLSALQKILQEVLDTDRTIVVGLYEKAKK